MALAPTTEIRLMLAGVAYFILFLDWLAMLGANMAVRWFSPLLLLIGVVLGVNQVALGIQSDGGRCLRVDSARRLHSPRKLKIPDRCDYRSIPL